MSEFDVMGYQHDKLYFSDHHFNSVILILNYAVTHIDKEINILSLITSLLMYLLIYVVIT